MPDSQRPCPARHSFASQRLNLTEQAAREFRVGFAFAADGTPVPTPQQPRLRVESPSVRGTKGSLSLSPARRPSRGRDADLAAAGGRGDFVSSVFDAVTCQE